MERKPEGIRNRGRQKIKIDPEQTRNERMVDSR